MSAMIWGLVAPALLLGALGWLVPRALARLFPEGPRALVALALVAAGLTWALAAGVFALLYLVAGAPAALLWAEGGASLRQFGRLGLSAALVWGPVLLLSVADLPRRWTRATW